MSAEISTKRGDSPSTTQEAAGYKVLFIGLACHLNNGKEKDGRRVLWPDGSNPSSMVTPHYAYIAVDPDSILDKSGWYPVDATQEDLMNTGLYRLPKCTISMTGADKGSGVDTTDHDAFLPKLDAADPRNEIDPNDVDAIAEMTIRNGKLTALRTPEMERVGNRVAAAAVSQLEVPHIGEITVAVTPEKGAQRTLRLMPGTTVAIANIAFPDEGTGVEHFSIYGRLTRTRTLHGRAALIPDTVGVLPTDHHLFTLGVAITDGRPDCGVQACCSPG